MSRRLVITSSAAILAVYAVGFVRTQAAADRVSAAASQFQPGPASTTASPTQPTPVPTPVAAQTRGSSESENDEDDDENHESPSSVSTASPAAAPGVEPANTAAPATAQPAAPTATPAPSTASRYRDGTFSGTGMSRHGDIAAQVTVKGGKIFSTQITGCYTRYPCSRISDLPTEVVGQQSTSVDVVSGATDSSEAFLQAVDNALQKALG